MSQERRIFPARMAAFPRVAAFIEEVCAAAGFSRQDYLKLRLIVEELFTNTVVHGHGGDSDEPVSVAFDARAGRIALTYEDTGPPFNPFSAVESPAEATEVEQRAVGGLGVLLIANLAKDIEYAYAGGRNQISLVVSAPR